MRSCHGYGGPVWAVPRAIWEYPINSGGYGVSDMKPALTCPGCSGSGRVPRDRRRLDDGKVDPLDFRAEELCAKCGGSGRVFAPPARPEEPKPAAIGPGDCCFWVDHGVECSEAYAKNVRDIYRALIGG